MLFFLPFSFYLSSFLLLFLIYLFISFRLHFLVSVFLVKLFNYAVSATYILLRTTVSVLR
jgi:hypothetical protein